jgi:glycine oxidase ThiO
MSGQPTSGSPRARGADVVVVGGGLIGLATALALSERGAAVALIDGSHPGEASHAAAGMLAPGMERATGAAHTFALAARDFYPGYLDALAELSGIRVPLNRDGVLELILDETTARSRSQELDPAAHWLTPTELRRIEPALAPAAGAVLYPLDGAVDNVTLLHALRTAVSRRPTIARIEARATSLQLEPPCPEVELATGGTVRAPAVVLAAGAWSPLLQGLPRPIPVEPVRGQAIALAAAPLHHTTYGPNGYVVPRSPTLSVVGATMERVGYELGTTPEGMAGLKAAAKEIAPSLGEASVVDRWSGLRPVTPDLLPIIGCDPDCPSLIYACGHSRNGILLGPLTGECVAALASGESPGWDLSPFSIVRFAASL